MTNDKIKVMLKENVRGSLNIVRRTRNSLYIYEA